MNIAISGYGKMGKSIENQLIAKHNLIIVSPETNTSFKDIKVDIDVIIDFSNHEVIKDIEKYLLNKKCSLIIGTTGYSEEENKIIKRISENHVVIKSSNYSKGMNIFLDLISLIQNYDLLNEQLLIKEIHHKNKKDVPSGTALMIKDVLNKDIIIESIRKDEHVGEHQVIVSLNNEKLVLTHQAYSRDVFVSGVIEVLEIINNLEVGLYSLGDLSLWKEKKLLV